MAGIRPTIRPVDPRLKLAMRLLCEARHYGREQAATWEQLAQELELEGVHVSNVRRLREAASELRRIDKVAIGGVSGFGVFVARDDTDRKLIASERLKRLRAEAEELEAFDLALYLRIAGVLPLEGEG